MKRALCFVIFSLCTAAAWAADADQVLTANGLPMLPVGTKFAMLEQDLREKLPDVYQSSPDCVTLYTKKTDAMGVSFMLEGGHLARVNLDYTENGPSRIKTDKGIGLGATEDDVKQAYGAALVVKPNRYDPTWHYLVVDDPDHLHAIVFVTDGKKVTSIHAGEYPSVGYTEGCR
jgi:hypothetical protein